MAKGNGNGGYGQPPKAHQFKPGVSGNPRGRPRKSDSDEVLDAYERAARVKLRRRIDGKVCTLTRREYFEHILRRKAAGGESFALRETDRRAKRRKLLAQVTYAEERGGVLVIPHSPQVQAMLRKFHAEEVAAARIYDKEDDHGPQD